MTIPALSTPPTAAEVQADLERAVWTRLTAMTLLEGQRAYAADGARHAPDAATRERFETALTRLDAVLAAHELGVSEHLAEMGEAAGGFVRRVVREMVGPGALPARVLLAHVSGAPRG